MKRPLEMIAEWRKGCSVAGPSCGDGSSPADCFECTEALVRCLEKVLTEPSTKMIEDVAGAQDWDYRSENEECRASARLIFRVMTGAEPSPFARLHDAPED